MEFEKAYNRLKEINSLLQSGQIVDIQQIIDLQKEAEKIYKVCNEVICKNEKKIDSDWFFLNS